MTPHLPPPPPPPPPVREEQPEPPFPKPPHPPKPPHKERSPKALLLGLLLGSFITAIVGLILRMSEISINVILPVLAPIWVGSITLVYSVFRER